VLLITALITAIAAGALFISALGITNTMIMNVLERRREIAIMKAIGARDRDVHRMFMVEGMLIGVLGGLSGLLLGLGITRICGDAIRGQLERQLDEPLGADVFSYPLWLVIGTPVIAAIVTTLATSVPARRAARIDPATVLRGL
ncbi:MAG: FtsX-like permease family protein, partial [Pirellulaceae bacterium]|nr:FtsX-like permease family protein [Pirellulaceae bacterium]